MWQTDLKTTIRANRRLLGGSITAGLVVGAIWLLGYTVADTNIAPLAMDWPQAAVVAFFAAIAAALAFGLWTVRSTPRYPQSHLEHHQFEVEQEVNREWGAAISFLRGIVAHAENCSETVINAHKEPGYYDDLATASTHAVLIAQHTKICDLARSIADLAQRGHAESAFALWRSAFELEVNMTYICKQMVTDPEIGRRFQDWGTMTYLKFSDPDGEELSELIAKYPGWQTDSDIGWTHPHNLIGLNRRAQSAGYHRGERPHQYSDFDIYELANAFVHNDATAIFNDLGQTPPFEKGPTAKGLDLPLPTIASNIARATHILVDTQEADLAKTLRHFERYVRFGASQVRLECAMVPPRLATRFVALDMSITEEMEDGGMRIIVPSRRESDPEEEVRKVEERLKRET